MHRNIIINILWGYAKSQFNIDSPSTAFKEYFALELLTIFNIQTNMPIDAEKLILPHKKVTFLFLSYVYSKILILQWVWHNNLT